MFLQRIIRTHTNKLSSVRYLSLLEYQCKNILKNNGLPTQKFVVVGPDAEDKVIESFKTPEYVVKAQVLAGGRGKGKFINSKMVGGVKLTKDVSQAKYFTNLMLKDRLVTKQTDKNGELVKKVMLAEAVNIKRELYIAIVLDRSYDKGALLVTSPFGGIDIEENQDKIRKFTLPIEMELDLYTAQKISAQAFDINLSEETVLNQVANVILKLYKLFINLDASQVEINPLGITTDDIVMCIDAKLQFDENARYRQRWLDDLENDDGDPRDREAQKYGLNFVGLDGNIGCLVNGAGLAMATMDIINFHGGKPANFLDVGGSASPEQIYKALEIIASDNNVKSIFVNIFGGIMRCDLVAQGLIDAGTKLGLSQPVVARLQGSKVTEARDLIKSSKSDVIIIDDLNDAAQLAVDLSKF